MSADPPSPERDLATGLGYGLAAYFSWGLAPLFWKQLTHFPALELVGQRVIWACLFFTALAWMRGRLRDIGAALRDPRALRAIALSALLLAVNWLVFIYAVATARVLHASLGYFLTPVVSVLLGTLLLRERMRRTQWLAIGVASLGVAQYAMQAESLPWIGLVLASSFGVYGLVRKTVRVDALPGSTLETLLMLPFGLAYVVYVGASGQGALFQHSLGVDLLLVATGLITALPLLWFTNAARRLPLYVMGFLQYLAPSLQFLVAVVIYDEPFSTTALRSFAFIWAGLLLFSIDAWRARRRQLVALRAQSAAAE